MTDPSLPPLRFPSTLRRSRLARLAAVGALTVLPAACGANHDAQALGGGTPSSGSGLADHAGRRRVDGLGRGSSARSSSGRSSSAPSSRTFTTVPSSGWWGNRAVGGRSLTTTGA